MHATHPRPQLTRPQWIDCSGTWDFLVDGDDVGLAEGWWEAFPSNPQKIVVPYPVESPASGIGDCGFHRVVWYHRDLETPELSGDERVLLHIGACDYAATVWCNGQLVASHEGGHTPFSCDLTGALSGRRAAVVIRAMDDPADVGQPRGKQGWHLRPQRVWYPRTTGMWQPVWLEVVPSRWIAEVHWSTDLSAARVRCELRLEGRTRAEQRIRVRLEYGDVLLAQSEVLLEGRDRVSVELCLPQLENGVDRGQLLWSPESPTLVDATITLLDDNSESVDVARSYLGIRDVAVRDGHFLLNGRPYFLRFALEQGLWPETHLAAPDDAALRREVEVTKDLGFNGLRIHQKLEDPRFLYWCDRLGLMVWEEMPSCYRFGTDAVLRLTREWSEAVLRDRSHPCIVCWVPMNESWGVPDLVQRADERSLVLALVHLTRALDPTRPVISNDGWEHLDSDIVSIHDYAPDGPTLRSRYATADAIHHAVASAWPGPRRVLLDAEDARGQCVMVTEFGGLSLVPQAGEEWFGYATHTSPEQLEKAFVDLVGALLDSPEIAGFCYTQLTDTFQETNGILDARRLPKIPASAVRAAIGAPAASVPHEAVDQARSRKHRPASSVPPLAGAHGSEKERPPSAEKAGPAAQR